MIKRIISLILAVITALSALSLLGLSGFAYECEHLNTEIQNAVEATYTEDGYTGDTVCLDCGETISYGEVIPMLLPSGWVKTDEGYYYYNEDGEMQTGWVSYNEKWYYLDENGLMLTGWINVNDKWYFLKDNGAMKTGWKKYNGKWYYLGKNGAAKTGWEKINGNWYFFNDKGTMKTGWLKYNDKLYFLDDDGVMLTGWKKHNNKWYFLCKNGEAKTGWLKDNGKWYYFSQKGVMQTGWVKDNDNWYYLNKHGVMLTGWIKVNSKWYNLNKKGVMRTGWFKENDKWYYFGEDGAMCTGWEKIDGKDYYFGKNGVWKSGWNNVYTYYSSNYVNNYNRTQNMKIASKAINGTVLLPGEDFDFNKIVGPRTPAKGYLPAPVFSGGDVVDGIGGGICQVSSTIFNAALYANMQILERHQHSNKVYYVPFGRDATIYNTACNLRFRNTSDYAIKIRMTVKDGVITCEMLTIDHVKPPKVKLEVTQSGGTYILRRYVNGECNYTTRSTYR